MKTVEELENRIKELEDENAELKSDTRFLNALYAAGVDNWDGYDYAQELYQGE